MVTWFTLQQLESQDRATQITDRTTTVELIAAQSELALQDRDLPRLRRLLLDAQATGHFQHLSIKYANDQTLVSTDVSDSYSNTFPNSLLFMTLLLAVLAGYVIL